ncbi:receptor-like protein kinase 5 [Neltuma alba]|uniref:receptor-like protein kinase 5 n=1 Tax=Neltuma alba TaxID=207710 RepID=UPI0010A3F35B|nr:receptor-like protein kinase 5 [Prosopis alba]XP_028798348.1 receptor-like protein kinase 5 [Prosopis alba]XP_028798349.1 receptor-like protein kinase 5 [Prosopis alba]XP_028798350.1 receptor-like protein kinase 5 [Prosopis alba]XP_028798351.1 receptor-like protein kinase 5 [Prosopis alba]XP_028798352.1 receptor-like protein kinase 5 [Prosopis alba]XP_028798353.1 receptor-like protein kinase 5 [Prosopis alba]XP_028798354.1 receptor-like protein kinase 5 [Prosopis alba]
MPDYLYSIFFFFCCFFAVLSDAETNMSHLYDQEHAVLLNIKQHLHPFLDQWAPSDSSHCSWPGINCTHDSVTKLDFGDWNITKTMPPFLCDLRNLTLIDFQLNYFPGEFPKFLYNCSKLEYLDLSLNNFSGPIPNDIDRLAKLRFLNLGENEFSGSIPAGIGRLKELRSLQLHMCEFSGSIPDEIGYLSNLELLYLWGNKNLIGKIPESIGELVNLVELDLSQNGLSGQIPSGVFSLKNLSILYLWKNSLSGEIPTKIEALNLTILDVSRNILTGKIPDGLGKLKKLTGLSLDMNQLSGEIPESLAHLPALVDFMVFQNHLSGTLPPYFGRYSPLETFQVATNQLTGKLPEDLCYKGKLVGVSANDNNLSGELSESLGSCNSLQYLFLDNNSFFGKIPGGLWTSQNLVALMVNNNEFTGELPQRLAWNLSSLSISNNQFSGRIPTGVSTWKNLIEFKASKNFFNGSIPQELTTLPKLTKLLLDQNQLTGPLPSEIISWKSLNALNLSHNQLSGQIPYSFDSLPVLGQLDLSNNQLSGHVPPQLGKLSMTLTNLNLSSNFFTGKIPREFENLVYSDSFLNNSGLCANTKRLNLPLCNSGSDLQRSSNRSSVSLALIIGLVIVASLATFLSLLLIIRVYKSRKQELETSWKLTSFHRFSFSGMNIVSSLTDDNIIGRGGFGTVYQVPIDGLGYVAVKRIMNNKKWDQKLEDAFLAEVKILSNIRHNNIVKLLCCISSEDSLMLVYEYLENNSLDRWLSKKNRLNHNVILDWPKRLQIAIGAAQGLTYMHNDCFPPVIHRDIKISNILLDSEFNAKVADFGLARMLIKPSELTMSGVAGSFGYIAPEYIQTGKINEMIDVYSFGVVLLELTTAKEANYGDEHSSLADWACRHVQLGGDVEEVLDDEIKEACYMDEICGVFKLGVMCTAILPASRPSMKEVLQILLRCRDPFGYGERSPGIFHVVPLLKNSKRESRLDIDDDL